MQGLDLEYGIPKERLEVELRLHGRPAIPVRLYLSRRAQLHAGAERPSDLLNGEEPFIPVRDDEARVRLVPKRSIATLTVSLEAEAPVPGESGTPGSGLEPPPTLVQKVQVRLEDGTRLEGRMHFVHRHGAERLLDHLNGAGGRFLPLHDQGTVHLVNRDRIAWITPR